MHELVAHPQLPEAVEDTAARHVLGPLLAVYPSYRNVGLRIAGGVLALIIGVAMSGAYLLSYASTFAWLPWWQALIIPLIGCIWISVGCWALLAPFFQVSPTVYVYTEGLVYVRRKIEVIPWRKMERVWKIAQTSSKNTARSVPYTYLVRRSDNHYFPFPPQLSNIETLGVLLEQEITASLLPRAIAAYKRGETVLFDEIAVNEYGLLLREGRRKLPWSELEKLVINKTQLECYRQGQVGPWAIVILGAIPNVEVLRGLVAYVQRSQAQQTRPKIAAYSAGATVDFGAFCINQHGIALNGSAPFIPWPQISGIGVSDHEVIIGRKDTGEWHTFPDWMVQDTAGLKELVEYALQKKKA